MYASVVIGMLFAVLVNAEPQFPGPPHNWDGVPPGFAGVLSPDVIQQLKDVYKNQQLSMPQAALLSGIVQLIACCVFAAMVEFCFHQGMLGSRFRLVYIFPALFITAVILASAAYCSKGLRIYTLAMVLNGMGFICCLALLIWLIFVVFTSMRSIFPKNTGIYISLGATVILLVSSVLLELSLWNLASFGKTDFVSGLPWKSFGQIKED
ncbi:hypothetical protein DdX_18627 [Ditylenchus destructor]|uniref:Uncharacterized protein n=1 Tax=Ditylenchus destructor TaxID=166010 RepID=A0AAD4MKU4_9BILA|nr:hypothetical protein DdX_18627 [Ditylenchus destructor]